MNRVTLIGNLCADAEVRYMPNGDPVANVRVATNERWTDRQTGEIRERAEFHRITIFGQGLVEKVIEPYAKKGKQVVIEGELRTRKWTGADGVDHYTTEIWVTPYAGTFRLLGSPMRDPADDTREPQEDVRAAKDAPKPRARRQLVKAGTINDDIPF